MAGSSLWYLLLALNIRCTDKLSPLVEVGLDDLLEIFRRTPFRIDTKRSKALGGRRIAKIDAQRRVELSNDGGLGAARSQQALPADACVAL